MVKDPPATIRVITHYDQCNEETGGPAGKCSHIDVWFDFVRVATFEYDDVNLGHAIVKTFLAGASHECKRVFGKDTPPIWYVDAHPIPKFKLEELAEYRRQNANTEDD